MEYNYDRTWDWVEGTRDILNAKSCYVADNELAASFISLPSFSYSPVLKVHVQLCLRWHSLEEESVLPWAY